MAEPFKRESLRVNIALVEDDLSAADDLTRFFDKYGKTDGTAFDVKHFKTAEEFLDGYRTAVFSIVMMDIDLPGISGLEAARRLRDKDDSVVLLFVTKMAQYAQKGYEVSALDFLIKPVSYADFCLKIKKAVTVARARESRAVIVPVNNGFTRLSTDKIIFVEVMGHTIKYRLTDGELETRGTLSSVEKTLAGNGFLRCNSCYIVNTRFIDSVRGYDLEIAGYTLKISHPRRKEFVKALMELYMGGGKPTGGGVNINVSRRRRQCVFISVFTVCRAIGIVRSVVCVQA